MGIYIQLTNNYIGSKETLFGFLIIFLGLIVWKSGFSIHKNFNKNDIKIEEQKFNVDEELKKMIISEKNRQLNEFSIIHFKKIEQQIFINEK